MKRLPYTWFQRIVLALAAVTVLGMFLYTVINYQYFPDKIPAHFGADGEANAWGGKSFVWFMPAFSAALFVILSAVTYFPSAWNVPARVTERNMHFVYTQSKNMLCSLNLAIILIFFYVYVRTVKAAPLSVWFLPAVLIISVGGSGAWIAYIWRKSKTYE